MLGKGSFGLVTLMRSVATSELVAMKTIERSRLHAKQLRKSVEVEAARISNAGPTWISRPHRVGSLRSLPSPLRSLLASTGPHRRSPALLALATALTPGLTDPHRRSPALLALATAPNSWL